MNGAVLAERLRGVDAAAVALVEQACFSDPWSEETIRAMAESRLDFCFVLRAAGDSQVGVTGGDPAQDPQAGISGDGVFGYAALRIVADEAELLRIGVLPDMRGKGYGRELLERVTAFAREHGAAAMTLEVRAGNETARRLYESAGFAEEGRRKNYYREPAEDAVLMWNRSL